MADYMTRDEFEEKYGKFPDCYFDQDWGFKHPMSDYIGKRYGSTPDKYLEVLGCDYVRIKPRGYQFARERMFLCKCHKCGETKTIRASTVLTNSIATCGCSMDEIYDSRIKRFNKGDRFGMLTATGSYKRVKTSSGYDDIKWEFKCDCGNTCYYTHSNLMTRVKRGKYVVSCGCLANKHHGDATRKHGLSDSKLYNAYCAMIARCYNPNNPNYPNYEKRGIIICEEWYDPNESRSDKRKNGNQKFMNFVKWSYENGFYDQPKGTPRSKTLTIDRIDNDGPYAPWNCRWTTYDVQENNTSFNKHVRFDGKVYTYSQFRALLGMKSQSVLANAIKSDALDMHIWNMLHPDDKLHHVGHGVLTKFKDKDGFYRMLPRYNVEFID